MSQRCLVCHHPLRQQIDQRLMEGAGGRAVAREFSGFSSRAADRHRVKHLRPSPHAPASVVALAAPEAPMPPDFLDIAVITQDLHCLSVTLGAEAEAARASGARGQFLQVVDRLLAVLQQRVRLGGVAPSEPVVTVNVGSDSALVERLLARVGGNPEARAALARALLDEASRTDAPARAIQ